MTDRDDASPKFVTMGVIDAAAVGGESDECAEKAERKWGRRGSGGGPREKGKRLLLFRYCSSLKYPIAAPSRTLLLRISDLLSDLLLDLLLDLPFQCIFSLLDHILTVGEVEALFAR